MSTLDLPVALWTFDGHGVTGVSFADSDVTLFTTSRGESFGTLVMAFSATVIEGATCVFRVPDYVAQAVQPSLVVYGRRASGSDASSIVWDVSAWSTDDDMEVAGRTHPVTQSVVTLRANQRTERFVFPLDRYSLRPGMTTTLLLVRVGSDSRDTNGADFRVLRTEITWTPR